MKKIYLVLSHTGTLPSKFIRLYTRKEYSHVSISLDKELNEMYSFGRLNPYYPFWAGFVHEYPKKGTYKRFKNTKTSIYSLDVQDDEYEVICKTLKEMEKNKRKYGFNYIGFCSIPFHISVHRKHHFYCAEFIKYLFEKSNLDVSLPSVAKPDDFRKIEGLDHIYTGKLNSYSG